MRNGVENYQKCVVPLLTYLHSTANAEHRDFLKALLSEAVVLQDKEDRLTQDLQLISFRGREVMLPDVVVYDISAGRGKDRREQLREQAAAQLKSRGARTRTSIEEDAVAVTVVVHPYLGPNLIETAAFMHLERGEWAHLAMCV